MGPGVGVLLALGVLFVLLFLGSALLRGAVALANRTIGPVGRERIIGWDWDAEEDEDEEIELGGTRAMPEPGIGQGMFAVFVLGLIHLVLAFVFRTAFELDRPFRDSDELPAEIMVLLLSSLIGFFALSGLLSGQLETKWRWACLAAFFFYLISVFIVLFVAGLLYLVFAL